MHFLIDQDAPEIRKVTLMPRGSTLGMVNYLDKEETEASLTKSELISRIQVAMGGRYIKILSPPDFFSLNF